MWKRTQKRTPMLLLLVAIAFLGGARYAAVELDHARALSARVRQTAHSTVARMEHRRAEGVARGPSRAPQLLAARY